MFRAFFKAVCQGTLAGGLPFMAITVPIAVSGDLDLLSAIYLAGLPIGVAFTLVLVSGLLVGLPINVMLQRHRIASGGAYLVAGSRAGCLVLLAILFASGGVADFSTAALGAFSGAMTARSWAKSLGFEVASIQAT